MMYSATLLASLLASAHGFAATPTGGVECSANEEKFFVYSVDPSMVYPFVATLNASLAPPSATKDLVGNTWQGLQLSITQGDTTITQAGGKPLTVTSPSTLDSGGFNVVSEDFCLNDGNWTVRTGAFAWGPSTHPEFGAYNATAGSYLTLEERSAPGAPINTVPVKPQDIVDWVKVNLGVDVNNFENSANCTSDPSVQGVCSILSPFEIRWAIFPAEMHADAEAAAATGPYGMSFIEDNVDKAWAVGEVDYEEKKVVLSHPLVTVIDSTEYNIYGEVAYASIFCGDDDYDATPSTKWKAKSRGICLVCAVHATVETPRGDIVAKSYETPDGCTTYSQFAVISDGNGGFLVTRVVT